jgi:hypothetical protein
MPSIIERYVVAEEETNERRCFRATAIVFQSVYIAFDWECSICHSVKEKQLKYSRLRSVIVYFPFILFQFSCILNYPRVRN